MLDMANDWLVVSNIFYFPFHIWDVILPIDFHSFQDGYCTTNQMVLAFPGQFLAHGQPQQFAARCSWSRLPGRTALSLGPPETLDELTYQLTN
jgi:hypothetical protein